VNKCIYLHKCEPLRTATGSHWLHFPQWNFAFLMH